MANNKTLSFDLTEEQEAFVEMFKTGKSFVVTAGAGAAKTTTCVIASKTTKRRGSYIAYNSSIAAEAKQKFDTKLVAAKTSHGFAFGQIGMRHKHKIGPSAPVLSARNLAQWLKINQPYKLPNNVMLAQWSLARMARDTVRKFCYSADREITRWHVPYTPGMDPDVMKELAEFIVPYATKIWRDYEKEDGTLNWGYSHDPYLKMGQLRGIKLPGEYFMLDEAQDTNACVQDIFENQDGQLIAVGDANQQLYAWRGAEDYMSKMKTQLDRSHWLTLSKSFRFGEAIADEANKLLELLQSELRIEGFDEINSEVVKELDSPDAVLCRTNAGVISQAMHYNKEGKRVAVVGGTADIARMAEGAIALQQGQQPAHPDMMAFKTWGEFKEFVEEEGSDLQVFVRIIDEYGAATVLDVAKNTQDEKYSKGHDVVLSTGHKAKGREWDKVSIGNDFQPPKDDEQTGEAGQPGKSELMLGYVCVTRAKNQLNRGSLEWVDAFLPQSESLATERYLEAENDPLTTNREVIS